MALGNWSWSAIGFDKEARMCGSQFNFNEDFYATIYKDRINFHHSLFAKNNPDSYFNNIFCTVTTAMADINTCVVTSKRINEDAAIFVICEFHNKDTGELEFYTGLGYIKKYPKYVFGLRPNLKKKYIDWLKKQSNALNEDYCQKIIEYMNRL